jgi:hypothetical protein
VAWKGRHAVAALTVPDLTAVINVTSWSSSTFAQED